MGLDISGIKPNKRPCGNGEDTMEVFTLKGFERSLLESEKFMMDYETENYDYISDGLSMSYSGYNGFREALSVAALGCSAQDVWNRAADLEPDEDYQEALYHLINFADNEGYIGPKAGKGLATYVSSNFYRITNNIDEN